MQKGDVLNIVLGVIGVTGIVIAAATCPGILACVPRRKRNEIRKQSVNQAIRRLLRKGWIDRKPTKNGLRLTLTDRGHVELLKAEILAKSTQNRRWDGRWRLLIFDIPEKRRYIREQIRKQLRQFGFRRLQDSVWAFPFDCEDILELLRIKYSVRRDAIILEVKRIYPKSSIHTLFGLPTIET